MSLKDTYMIAPIIIGSIVNGGFSRKLRMLRADLFTLMSITQSKQFMKQRRNSTGIKTSVVNICRKSQRIDDNVELIQKLKGWNRILFDKMNDNFLTDVFTLNQPDDLNVEPPEETTYIYSAFLQPGNHTVLIYDPLHKRAFCKEFIVKLNTVEHFPEYPDMGSNSNGTVKNFAPPKPKQNVWR